MEPEVSIEGSAMIQVAVVPIGTLPSNLLQDCYSMLLPLHTIPLSAISSFYTEHQKSPFAVQPWDSGSLRFKFVLGGAPPSPWEDFQYHRKTLAIVGIVHCPSSPDLDTTVDLFANACKSFPSSLVDRCFAFCPDDSQLEDGSKKGGNLRLFPPADRPTLEFHLNTMMQEIAASLLMEFEKWVLQAESSGTILKTPLDSQASLSSEEAKKRRLGRAQKTIGDCCLLAGSPVDANAHYSTALELARLTGDYFWYAGALEGSVCALLIDRMGQKDSALEDEVRYRYNSIILNYKKSQDNAQGVSPLTFELEATLKLARFLCRRELSKEVVELLTTAADGAKSLIDASDRLILYNEIARLYASLGYHRKAAFFSRQVAQLYLQQENSVDDSVEREIASFRDSETQNNLRRILESCSKLVEAGDFHESENTVSELVKFLGSVYDAAVSDPDSEHAENEAFEAIFEIHRYICSPSLHQEVVDALSFELPKVVSKFVGISSRFLDMAINIIDQFIVKCGPRDMLSILCNTLGYSTKITKAASYIVPPLSGISKVFISIQRRQFEQVKEAVPIILNVLKAVPLESEEELESVFDRAVGIANSMYQVCNKLEGDAKEKLQTLLGLYVLQCMALISASLDYKASSCHSFVSQLSQISSYCGLSYLSLLTTYEVETMAGSIFGEDKDHYMGFLSHVKLGAALSVIWGLVSEEIAHTAKENLTAIKDELCNNQTKRWQAIGSLKQVLSFVNLPWELKKHAIDFLLCITDGRVSRNCNEEHSEWSSYMPSLFSALQAVKMVIMHAPEPELRKKSFVVLKGVLADIPISQRLDILQALITNTDSPSMIAIFIDLIRKEMHTAICSSRSIVKDAPQIENKAFPSTPFWNPRVIELVELVLRPPQGGPPSLPEQGDAVLSALNLYRFVLMTESAEKTNCTGLLSRKSLLKAYNEWLLPLRTLVTGIIAESKSDYDEFAVDTVCTLNPLELVLYRCIELVEEKLKQST